MKNEASVTVNFGWAIFIVLLVLKLGGVLKISWWLVTLPLWFGLAVVAIVVGVLGISILIAKAF